MLVKANATYHGHSDDYRVLVISENNVHGVATTVVFIMSGPKRASIPVWDFYAVLSENVEKD